MPNEEYTAQGPGSVILPYPALSFLLTTEPFLGTAVEGVPNGPFNRELHKLLQNTASVADMQILMLSATMADSFTAVPATTANLNSVPGGPSTPVDHQIHRVWYNAHLVVYMYDNTLGQWVELARRSAPRTTTRVVTKRIVQALLVGANTVTITLPAIDDPNFLYNYQIEHLKHFYVENLDQAHPLISVSSGYWPITPDYTTQIKFQLSAAPLTADKYRFVMVLEILTAGYNGY